MTLQKKPTVEEILSKEAVKKEFFRVVKRTQKVFTEEEIDEIIEEGAKGLSWFDLEIMRLKAPYWCNRCGYCCRESEPIVLTIIEIGNIANFLKMSINNFYNEYVKIQYVEGEKAFVIKKTKPCVFLENETNHCTIYPVRPLNCQNYPFNFCDEGYIKKYGELHGLPNPHKCNIVLKGCVQRCIGIFHHKYLKKYFPDKLKEKENLMKKILKECNGNERLTQTKLAKLATEGPHW